jgi:hypothetical protein
MPAPLLEHHGVLNLANLNTDASAAHHNAGVPLITATKSVLLVTTVAPQGRAPMPS